jgi:integral membrane protein
VTGATGHTVVMVSMTDLSTPATRFRLVAVLEAISWAGLLIAMFFKWVVGANPTDLQLGVQIVGPIHGAVFLAYVLVTLMVARPLDWSLRTTGLALVASVPPFGSIVFERWAAKRGELAELSVA